MLGQLVQYDREKPLTRDSFIYNEGYWEDLGVSQPNGFWPMLGPESKGNARDYSPYINDGILTSGCTWDKTPFGTALKFDGSSGWLNCGSGNSLNVTTTISFGCWFYTGTGSQNAGLIGRWISGGNLGSNAYLIYLGQDVSNTKYSCIIEQSNSTTVVVASTGTYSLNALHFITCVADGGTIRLYLDGVQVNSASYNGTINNPSRNLVMGRLRQEDTTYSYTGYIDEAFETSAVWGAQQIAKHYAERFAMFEYPVTRYFPISSTPIILDPSSLKKLPTIYTDEDSFVREDLKSEKEIYLPRLNLTKHAA